MDWNGILRNPRHLAVPLGASKMNFEPVVHLGQTVHLSYTDTNTISKRTDTNAVSKQTEMSFHLNLVN
jgi:hypothetical protein